MGKGGLLGFLGFRPESRLTLEEFRRRVAEQILARRPDAKLELVDDDELAYGGGGWLNVANGYAHYLEHPRGLDRAIGRLVDLALYEPRTTKPEDLIILVRPVSFLAGNDEADRGLARPLAAGLIALVAADTPQSYVFGAASEFRRDLAMDDAQIWDRARANLEKRLRMTPPKFRSGKVMGIKSDIGLAASLLVEDNFWSHPNLSSLSDLVVAPLEKDELLIAPLAEAEVVQALRNIVAQRRSAEFLCDRLLLRRNGAWEEFE